MTLAAIPSEKWPVEYRKGRRAIGPDREGYCPCGSRRRSRSCHARRDGTWAIPEKPPLISSTRTGYSNPGCYAAVSNDCSEKMSKEHWISANMLRAISQKSPAPGRFKVQGLRWQGDDISQLSVKGMQAKILCQRHNSALSPLDAEAGEMFRVIQKYQGLMESSYPINLFAIFDGPSIERWLVKFLLGGVASHNIGLQDRQMANQEAVPNYDRLLESLFRRSSVVPDWTLYQHGQVGRRFKSAADIELAVYRDSEMQVTGCAAAIGTTCLMLALEEISPGIISKYFIVRPAGFVTDSAVVDSQTLLALSWPSSSAKLSSYTYYGIDNEASSTVPYGQLGET
jgi:hypothetical protein